MSFEEPTPDQPPPYQPTPYQQPAYLQPPPTSSKATTSMILGIVSLVACGFFLGIPAIIVGRGAKAEIRASNGQLGGDAQATVGIVTGIIATAWSGLALLLVIGVFAFGGVVASTFENTCSTVTQDGAVSSC